ncbi:serine protease inhibitor swm-1-like [Xenopus tropicalis]|uniref:Serine protease inhibitor swm-1-like n=1 Tax=Xenopus tropicalis TaxID=8364 RepID=A0A8J1JYV7_XENTR|nr:serine protease inhibitor swm-1-like [Xenopus tropicalis]
MLRPLPIPLVLALALTATLVISQNLTVNGPRCPVNQQWYPCKPCPKLCGGKHNNCPKILEAGCSCIPGFVKQTRESTECIPEDKCINCKDPQTYSQCYGHCPPTCEPSICTQDCRPGCICKEGFVWLNERCVPRSECPAIQ